MALLLHHTPCGAPLLHWLAPPTAASPAPAAAAGPPVHIRQPQPLLERPVCSAMRVGARGTRHHEVICSESSLVSRASGQDWL